MSIPSGPLSSLHPRSVTPAWRRSSCFTGVSRSFERPGPVVSLTAEGLRWALVNVTADQERISSIIEERSALTEPEIAAFFGEQRRLTAAGAVTAGIVREVKEACIPRGNPVVTVNLDG